MKLPDATTIKLPDTVYILAPGANADPRKLPLQSCCIGVNAGAIVTDWSCDYWLVADRHCPQMYWWPDDKPCTCIFGFAHDWADYTFLQSPALGGSQGPGCIEGVLRCNGTVVGQAIQLCYWAGVKRCILNGVDMYGDHYYDGSKIYNGRKVWRYIDHLNPLIDWIHRNSKMRVTTQTKTELSIENHA